MSSRLDDPGTAFPDESVIVGELIDLVDQYGSANVPCAAADCGRDLLLKEIQRSSLLAPPREIDPNHYLKPVGVPDSAVPTCYDDACFELSSAPTPDAVVVFERRDTRTDGTTVEESSLLGTKTTTYSDARTAHVDIYEGAVSEALATLAVVFAKESSDHDDYRCLVDGVADDPSSSVCTLTSDADTVTCDCTKSGISAVGVQSYSLSLPDNTGSSLTTGELAGVVGGAVGGLALTIVVVIAIVVVVLCVIRKASLRKNRVVAIDSTPEKETPSSFSSSSSSG